MYQALGLHYSVLVFYRFIYVCFVRHTPSLTDVFDMAHGVNVRALCSHTNARQSMSAYMSRHGANPADHRATLITFSSFWLEHLKLSSLIDDNTPWLCLSRKSLALTHWHILWECHVARAQRVCAHYFYKLTG